MRTFAVIHCAFSNVLYAQCGQHSTTGKGVAMPTQTKVAGPEAFVVKLFQHIRKERKDLKAGLHREDFRALYEASEFANEHPLDAVLSALIASCAVLAVHWRDWQPSEKSGAHRRPTDGDLLLRFPDPRFSEARDPVFYLTDELPYRVARLHFKAPTLEMRAVMAKDRPHLRYGCTKKSSHGPRAPSRRTR